MLSPGIEWDDPTRGKHDGSVTKDGEVIRLFQCEAGRGSFLKLRLVRTGTSMVDALVDKYEGAKLDGMESVNTTTGGEMEVEFVGEDHIRCDRCCRGSCVARVLIVVRLWWLQWQATPPKK